MYKDFFGLNRNPFELPPDPSFIYASENISDALASIRYSVSQRKGIAVMTGEVGTGKTLVLRCLFESWRREGIAFANIFAPRFSVIDFLTYAASDLGIAAADNSKANLLRAFYRFVLAQGEKGLTTVLVVDEAHQAPANVLEEIRMLTNVETHEEKLVQILLVGQPELDAKLDSFELRQLKQRIAVRCQLEPLSEDESRHYIEQRLRHAGAGTNASKVFPAETVRRIYRYSEGIPRVINSICDQALIGAFARNIPVVPAEIIDQIASQFRLVPARSLGPTKKVWNDPGAQGSEQPSETRLSAPAAEFPSIGDVKNWVPAEPAADFAVLSPSDLSFNRKTSRARWPGLLKPVVSIGGILLVVGLAFGGIAVSRRSPAEPRYYASSAPHALPVESVAPQQATATPALELPPTRAAATTTATDSAKADPIPPEAESDGQHQQLGTIRDDAAPRPQIAAAKLSRAIANSQSFLENEQPPVLNAQENSLPKIDSDLLGGVPSAPVNTSGRALGGNLEAPKLISSSAPAYPWLARNENVGGVVVIDAIVNTAGKVSDMKVIAGPSVLVQAAMDALRSWRYRPARLDGHLIEAHTIVHINFNVRQGPQSP